MTDKNPLPWSVQPYQADQGESTTICDANAYVLCIIPSPAWDKKADLEYPEDRVNARLFAAAKDMLAALEAASALISNATDAGLLDLLAADMHPDEINAACDLVTAAIAKAKANP